MRQELTHQEAQNMRLTDLAGELFQSREIMTEPRIALFMWFNTHAGSLKPCADLMPKLTREGIEGGENNLYICSHSFNENCFRATATARMPPVEVPQIRSKSS